MLKLFFSAGSCALASRIALEDARASYELVRVDLANGQQRLPEFLKINPKSRVPALVTDRGVITETPAILAYIAQTFPDARLAPLDDPFEFARLQAFNAYLCSTVHVAHAHRFRGARWATEQASFDDMKRKVPENMTACMALIESDALAGPWVMGEHYSVADAYLHTVTRWLEGDGVDIGQFPKLRGHHERMAVRPSVLAALA